MPRKNNRPIYSPLRFVSVCGQKRRFVREPEAVSAADYQMLIKPGLELSVYKCNECGGWHLTRHQSRTK